MKKIGKEKTLEEFLRTSKKKSKTGIIHAQISSAAKEEYLFTWTGHPFTDAGLVALLLLSKKHQPKELTGEDIEQAVEFAAELYLKEGWGTLLARIYRNNNPILMVNPSMRKNATKEKLEFSLKGLFKLIKNPGESEEICQICGRYPALSGMKLRSIINTKERERPKEITGDIFPLLGTGDMRNYFPHGNKMGASICAHCLLLAQLFPIASYIITTKKGKVGGILVLHAYPYEKNLELLEDAVGSARKSYLYNNAKGMTWPVDFIFDKIADLSKRVDLGYWNGVSIVAYYFLNGNRTGEQWIYTIRIPNPVILFIAYASTYDNLGWKRISSKRLGKKSGLHEYSKLTSKEAYSKLLNGESILPYFIDKKNRLANAKWSLLAFYCSEVLGLDKEALEFIKGVADRIVETVEKLPDNKLSRRVRELEKAGKLYQFEGFFIRVEKDRQEFGIPEALMSFDDFARILTSYGEDLNVSWKTVKNLLLFRIYEKLHDRLMKASLEEVGESEEVEEEFEEGGEE